MFDNFQRRPAPVRKKDDCKIRIKNSSAGRTISFSGNCSKEQLQMAKFMNNAETVEEED